MHQNVTSKIEPSIAVFLQQHEICQPTELTIISYLDVGMLIL